MDEVRRPAATALTLVVLLTMAACGSTVAATSQDGFTSNSGAEELGQSSGSELAGESAIRGAGATATTRPNGRSRLGTGAPATVAATGARNTAPLTIGLTYADNTSTESALGVSSEAGVNGRTAAQAVVRGINAAGGLYGRMLKLVEYRWDSSSTSYDADATVACERFTKDNQVEVVVDTAFGTIGGFGDCLQRAGVLHLTTGGEGDRAASQRRTLHANTSSMVMDRTYGSVISNLVSTRYLGRVNQLGVIVEQCPSIENAYNRTIKPLIAQLGLKAPFEATIECTTGFSSAGPAASAVSSAILAFRQRQVDRVMFISDYEAVVLLLFANSASAQQYRPGYALSSGAQADFLRTQVPSDQLPQFHGVGTSPAVDVGDSAPPPSPTEARCVQLARNGGLVVGGSIDRSFVYSPCGLLLLLEAALTRTNGASAPRSLIGAINGLGTSVAIPGLVADSSKFSSAYHDGPNAVQVFAYVAACNCLRYSGGPLPAPA